MRKRFRGQAGRPVPASRLARAQRGATALGMMAFTGRQPRMTQRDLRAGTAMGMMAASGKRGTTFTPRALGGGCELDGSEGKSCQHYNSQGVPCNGICSGGQCDCYGAKADFMRATGRDDCGFLRQSGDYTDAFEGGGLDGLLDYLGAEDIYEQAFTIGGSSSLLDALANQPMIIEEEPPVMSGGGDGMPPPVDFSDGSEITPVPVMSGGGDGMPPPPPVMSGGGDGMPPPPVMSGGGDGMPPPPPAPIKKPVRRPKPSRIARTLSGLI